MMTSSLPELTPAQLAISHILADYFASHAELHRFHGELNCDHICHYCETLNDMELYIQSRIKHAPSGSERIER